MLSTDVPTALFLLQYGMLVCMGDCIAPRVEHRETYDASFFFFFVQDIAATTTVGHSTVSLNIPEVCRVLWEDMAQDFWRI